MVTMPPNLNGGQFTNQNIRLIHEGAGTVTAGMPAFPCDSAIHNPSLPIVSGDVTFGNAITNVYSGPGLPPVGTQVYSVFLHFDPNLSGLPFDLSKGKAASGTIVFSRPIIGVYVTSGALNATDHIFTPSGVIFPTISGRDMEFNYDGDQFAISADRLTLSVTMFSHNGGVLDEMRVILPATSSVTVPDVVNLVQAGATNAIISAGLSVGTIAYSPHGIVPAGSVISQNPAAGTSAATGSPVDLVISSGVTVPLVSETALPDGAFQISVSTLTGRLYILQYLDDLSQTNWTNLQSVNGDGNLHAFIDPSATTNNQRFYRVRVE